MNEMAPPPTADRTSIDLPMQTRMDVRLMPETVAEDARTIEVVWSTGAPVQRRDLWTGKAYDEVLSLDPAHVDLTRLNNGAPFLDTHGAFDLEDVIGVVERAWIAREGSGLVGRAVVRFSDRAGVEPIWRDVRNGIIRNVSVGYRVRTYEVTEDDGKVPVWKATDWEPLELSAVPVGADGAAGFRAHDRASPCRLVRRDHTIHHEDTAMPDAMTHERTVPAGDPVAAGSANAADAQPARASEPDPAAAPAEPSAIAPSPVAPEVPVVVEPPAPSRPAAAQPAPAAPSPAAADASAVAGRILADERTRITGIYDAARKLGLDASVADDLVRRGIAVGEARGALIDTAANHDRAVETRPHIRVGGLDQTETRRAAVENALLHRFDPNRFQLTEAAREWRGLSLIEMARSFLEAEGVRVRGLARDEIATRALHTTSDFPAILAGVTNRTLREAYDVAPRTFQAIARRATAADFKNIQRLQLGEAPQLEKVNEAGEFKRGTIGEAKESYRVETYGKVVGITRQVIVNDDLDAFTRVPSLFGTAAATLESDVVWGIVAANPAMADGKALFHAGHGNLAATGTALDVINLAKARTAMSRQTGLDGKTVLNIRPAFLVVPTSLELAAEQLLAQNIVPAKSGDVVPASIRSLAVISEPRLDPASGAVPWYLVASPAAIDTIEYAYLEGQDGVAMETRMGFDVDGIEIKARLDFGAKAIDWRGLHKNPGVALS